MTAGLERALEATAPDGWLAIGVTLREDALSQHAAARLGPVAARQQRVLDALPRAAFALKRRYRVLAGFAGSARPEAVEALRRHPDVRSVYADGRVRASLVQGVPQVGADEAQALGLSGAGVTVAILDTGIDGDHPDLADDLVAERCWCSDPHPSPVIGSPCCPGGQETQSGPGAAEDDDGHGTSVSGIVTSAGGVAPPGIAPDAGIVAIRVLGPSGGAFSDIAAGLDWVLLNRDAFADPIRVVNLSLGDGEERSDPLASPCSGSNTANAIAALWNAGVVVFAASGNEGFDDGISFPACVPEAISVGGVYDASFAQVSWCGNATCTTTLCTDTGVGPDDFVCHSNSDEILDLLAPDYVTSTTGLAGGVESSFGGTSAASPYAAAQAALLLEAEGGLSPAQVRSLLVASGPSVTNPDNGLSFPRSDVGEIAASIVATCGNGLLEPGEDCDDGGVAGGDCCAADCSFESEGSGCDDADACTTADVCDGAGACVGGAPPTCDDANVCTDDACDPASGCVHTPNTAACEDGDACTIGDLCDGAGSCVGGEPPDCDDGNPCTAESCDAVEGCVSTPVEGCTPPVPALPAPWGLLLVAGLLAASAASSVWPRRGAGKR